MWVGSSPFPFLRCPFHSRTKLTSQSSRRGQAETALVGTLLEITPSSASCASGSCTPYSLIRSSSQGLPVGNPTTTGVPASCSSGYFYCLISSLCSGFLPEATSWLVSQVDPLTGNEWVELQTPTSGRALTLHLTLGGPVKEYPPPAFWKPVKWLWKLLAVGVPLCLYQVSPLWNIWSGMLAKHKRYVECSLYGNSIISRESSSV